VRRRPLVAPTTTTDVAVPPELLNRRDPKWRTWEPSAADLVYIEQQARINHRPLAEYIGMWRGMRAHRAWSDALNAWALENGFEDAQLGKGNLDWHRLSPVLHAARQHYTLTARDTLAGSITSSREKTP
jgi:hypothetical protein